MASASQSPPTGPAALSPAQRQRLQQLFDHANRTADQAVKQGVKSNYDYAHDLYGQCVAGDPGNVIYIKAMMDNLYKKFGGKRKTSKLGGWLGGGSGVGALKKYEGSKDWSGLIKAGCGVLKRDPWDSAVLLKMSEAADKLHLIDAQLAFLKGARTGSPKDPNVNKTCALALARRGRYDDAIECWRRVAEAKPGDPEADAAIAKLAVDKTVKEGKYEEAKSTTDAMADAKERAERKGEVERETPEEKWRKAIEANPTDVMNYIELAEVQAGENRYDDAEATLAKALEASGGDVKMRELLEDMQIRRAKNQVLIAKRRAAEQPSEEATALHQNMLAELNRREIAVFASRCERYPGNTAHRFELGVRLRRAANYNEAIKYLQQAKNDPKRKGIANYELGECFRLIKQYPLAIGAYEAAIEALTAREEDVKKQALYWAGKVALLGTRDLEKADKLLNALAGIDFGYKDLPTLLDKLQQMRQNQ